MNAASQNSAILAYLEQGNTLTHMEAERRFGCARLAARIKDLRNGELNHTKYDIKTVMESQNGKRFAQYRLMTPRLRLIESIEPYKPVETNRPML